MDEEPTRDAWLLTGLRLSNRASGFMAEVRERLDHHEAQHGNRKRARRSDAVPRWESTVEAFCAGLVRVTLGDYPGGLVVSLAKPHHRAEPSRYDLPEPPAEMRREAVELFCGSGLAKLRHGKWGGHRSTLSPTAAFRELVEGHCVTLADIVDEVRAETIMLRGPKGAGQRVGKLVDYLDTPETMAMREVMRELNQRLASADITIAEGGPKVDTTRRTLFRVFNRPRRRVEGYRDFAMGGRLYGGWWQDMPKAERLHWVRIDGSHIGVVDWSAAWLRMAYAKVAMVAPEGDLYVGIGPYDRKAVKRAVNAMLCAPSPLTRFPRGLREQFPSAVTWKELRRAVHLAHPPVGLLEGTSFALSAMRLEATALLAALHALHEQGITALPIHDAVAVPSLHASSAKAIMETAFRTYVGIEGKAEVEGNGCSGGTLPVSAPPPHLLAASSWSAMASA